VRCTPSGRDGDRPLRANSAVEGVGKPEKATHLWLDGGVNLALDL
jgi:hypothetical protein